LKNFLLDAKHTIDGLTRDGQKGLLRKIKGKVVRRMGKLLEVRSASRKKGVAYKVVATGRSHTMGAKSFLSRFVEIVSTPPELNRKLDVPAADRAYDIAVATEVGAAQRIKRLYKVRKQAKASGDTDGVKACDHYIGLLKRGEPVKKWKPDK